VARTHSRAGVYTATLTVTDSAGATASTTLPITVGSGVAPDAGSPAPPPVADAGTVTPPPLQPGTARAVAVFDGSTGSGPVPHVEYLDGTLSSSNVPGGWIVDYVWDFGDGTPPVRQGWVEHLYAAPGTFVATLTVTDSAGSTARTALTITVGSGMAPDAGIPAPPPVVDAGTVMPPPSPPGTEVLAEAPVVDMFGKPSWDQLALHAWLSGAQVLAAGSIEWSWALSTPGVADAQLQRTTANFLHRTGRSICQIRPGTRCGGCRAVCSPPGPVERGGTRTARGPRRASTCPRGWPWGRTATSTWRTAATNACGASRPRGT